MAPTVPGDDPGTDRFARITDNPHLPTPPGLALQVLEKASQPHCALVDLETIISHDPALCGKILKTVNSALYGLPRAVTSIGRALCLLGLTTVRSLVLSLSLPALQRQTGGSQAEIQDYWKTSVAGAIVARELAIHRGLSSPDDLLVAGLLRDMGSLILPQVFPEEHARLADFSPEELARRPCEIEEELFGLNHAEVTAHVLRRWRLPKDVTEPIRFHHHPERASQGDPVVATRATLLAFASQVAQLQRTPWPAELLQEVLETARERLEMSEEDLIRFLTPLNKKIADFAALANLDIGQCEKFPGILADAQRQFLTLTGGAAPDPFARSHSRILPRK